LDDPLFPATKVAVGDNLRFGAVGLHRKHWSNAGPIRTIFKNGFAAAGLPYFNPHSFRKTLALLGGQKRKTSAALVAPRSFSWPDMARGAMMNRGGIPFASVVVMILYERAVAAIISGLLALAGAYFIFGHIFLDQAAGGGDFIKIIIG
jgi:hypothetical protein